MRRARGGLLRGRRRTKCSRPPSPPSPRRHALSQRGTRSTPPCRRSSAERLSSRVPIRTPSRSRRSNVGQRFSWHYDEVPKSLLAKEGSGGQRRATLLVYLNDVALGGATAFRDLGVTVQPRKGRALLFFPSDCDSTPDERTLHAGEAPLRGEKWIAQFRLHERSYTPVVVPDGLSFLSHGI
mmetsp:Transcript_23039/g.58486  ORF Transcript_23039/g.58486 Transcript_23039/m.58486 type:complete len:182 (+) Transcript_23039:184-729(+)